MAKIEISSDMVSISNDLEKAANGFRKLRKEILKEQAILVQKSLQDRIRSDRLINTGQLLSSVGYTLRKDCAIVGPSGDRKVKITRRGKKHETTNGQVGYILEYGAYNRGIYGRYWMTYAVNKVRDPVAEIAARKISEHLEKNNL